MCLPSREGRYRLRVEPQADQERRDHDDDDEDRRGRRTSDCRGSSWTDGVNRPVLERARITGKENPDLELWLAEYDRLRRAIVRLQRQRDVVSRNPSCAARKSILTKMDNELKLLKKSQSAAKEKIEKHGAGEDFDLVVSINGLGALTAAALVCKIRDIDRFESADKLEAYFGEYPSLRQSGKRKGQVRVAQNGNGMIRHLLWNCAKVAARHNPACRALHERLIAAGNPPAYAWSAVARKLLQIVYGVLKSRKPWDPSIGVLTGS